MNILRHFVRINLRTCLRRDIDNDKQTLALLQLPPGSNAHVILGGLFLGKIVVDPSFIGIGKTRK